MPDAEKACPIVTRVDRGFQEVLAFRHPRAGRQFVKGGIQAGESPAAAAKRELREESGVTLHGSMQFIGRIPIGCPLRMWNFYHGLSAGLPDTWTHQTEDDHGHCFAFFWHPIATPLDSDWHQDFHTAFAYFAPRLRLP